MSFSTNHETILSFLIGLKDDRVRGAFQMTFRMIWSTTHASIYLSMLCKSRDCIAQWLWCIRKPGTHKSQITTFLLQTVLTLHKWNSSPCSCCGIRPYSQAKAAIWSPIAYVQVFENNTFTLFISIEIERASLTLKQKQAIATSNLHPQDETTFCGIVLSSGQL